MQNSLFYLYFLLPGLHSAWLFSFLASFFILVDFSSFLSTFLHYWCLFLFLLPFFILVASFHSCCLFSFLLPFFIPVAFFHSCRLFSFSLSFFNVIFIVFLAKCSEKFFDSDLFWQNFRREFLMTIFFGKIFGYNLYKS